MNIFLHIVANPVTPVSVLGRVLVSLVWLCAITLIATYSGSLTSYLFRPSCVIAIVIASYYGTRANVLPLQTTVRYHHSYSKLLRHSS